MFPFGVRGLGRNAVSMDTIPNLERDRAARPGRRRTVAQRRARRHKNAILMVVILMVVNGG